MMFVLRFFIFVRFNLFILRLNFSKTLLLPFTLEPQSLIFTYISYVSYPGSTFTRETVVFLLNLFWVRYITELIWDKFGN